MKLATQNQVRKIDELAAKQFGLSPDTLIENAGKALAEKFLEKAAACGIRKKDRVAVWCGPGNNGEDGRVMARHLKSFGYHCEVVEKDQWGVKDYDVVIDALFGVGLSRPIEGALAMQIQALNNASCKVIAIDIPSGLSADTGLVQGIAIKTDVTFTIYPPKPGLFLNEGSATAGSIFMVFIGLPKELLKQPGLLDTYLVDRRFAQKLLPARRAIANKTKFGHLLVVAGSKGMEGAAVLVTEAAARLGCGYVTICSLSSETYRRVKPDFLQLSASDFLKSDLKKYSAVVFGPGLGIGSESWKLLKHLLQNHPHVLVDADGLNLLAAHSVDHLPAGWILTPHAGELSRIVNRPAIELEADRLMAVTLAEKALGCPVLLKGFRTVLRSDGKNFVIYSGNVALAKAGSGDVLSGFIGSLMAQGLSSAEAAALGAYLHGRIADDWVRDGGSTRSLLASDLPERIDATLRHLKKTS